MTDDDGDRVIVKWKCSAQYPKCAGNLEFTSGTGKYQGISGGGSFMGHFGQASQSGISGWAVWEEVSYKFPSQ